MIGTAGKHVLGHRVNGITRLDEVDQGGPVIGVGERLGNFTEGVLPDPVP